MHSALVKKPANTKTDMGAFLGILGIVIVGIIVKRIRAKKREEHWNEHEVRSSGTSYTTKEQPDTKGLMLNTLTQIGCQPIANQDGTIAVQYQGENFHIEFGGMYARVWDPMWAGIKADDPDLPQVREAVNIANFNFGPTIVLTAPNDEGVIGFHSRRDIMLHPACPDNVPFVRAVLDSFFDAKEQFRQSYQQLNVRQMEVQKKRRPIGFNPNS